MLELTVMDSKAQDEYWIKKKGKIEKWWLKYGKKHWYKGYGIEKFLPTRGIKLNDTS